MDDAASTPSGAQEACLDACLARLEELKAIQARREVLEEQVFLEFVRANRSRINEFPLLETEQQSLMEMLLRRGEGIHPGHAFLRDRFAAYLIEVNHYGKAKAVGDAAAKEKLLRRLERTEAVLVKCLQGAVYASGLVKDNWTDALIRHFGEDALAQIEEITASLVFDEAYWRACVERFVKDRVRGAYDDILAERRFRLLREGQLLIVAFPFDAVLDKLKGTAKTISKTRVQTAFEEAASTPEGKANVETALATFLRADIPQWEKRTDREETLFAAQVAAMDAVTAAHRAAAGSEDDAAAQELRARQIAALCIGAALSLRVVREDFIRALRQFSPKEATWIVQAAGSFDAARLGLVLEHVMELDFSHLLREKGESDAGRIQVKTARTRRVPKDAVAALAAAGLGKVRRKQFFDEDGDQLDFLLFRPKNPAELEERLRLLQIEPELTRDLVSLWETASHKVELYVCINLAALGKVATNLSARITEILGRYGIAPPGAAEPAKDDREA
jgi:hypothetical protein